MDVSLYGSMFSSAMPEVLAREPWNQALDRVIQRRIQKWIDEDAYLQIYVRIRELPEWILDAMAPNVRADSYREDDDIETKRDKIELSFQGNNIKGTLGATKILTEMIFGRGKSRVDEWFNYEDDPGYFMLQVFDWGWSIDKQIDAFVEIMDNYKRLSIWLRKVLTMIQFPARPIYFNTAACEEMDLTLPPAGRLRAFDQPLYCNSAAYIQAEITLRPAA